MRGISQTGFNLSIKRNYVIVIGYILLIALAWRFIPHPVIVFAAGLVPLAVLFVLRFPFQMVLLFVVFSFFRLHEVFPQLYPLKVPLLLSLASLAALIWHIGLTKKIQMFWRPELTWMTVFFVLVLIGVIMASNRPIAIAYFKGIYWKIAIMTFAIAWLTRSEKDFAFAAKLITLSGIAVGCVALFNKANGLEMVEETRVTIGRSIGSVLGDPNDLALVLMFPAAFAIALILNKGLGKFAFVMGIIGAPVLFMAIIATQSRGGLLGILAVFGIFAYRKIKSKALFFILGAVAMVVLYAVAGISDRASGGAAEEGIDASAMGRLYAWEAAFGMALHNPLTGVGVDNFYSNYYYYSQHWDGLNHAVHSTWFGVLAETGFLGLIVFLIIIGHLLNTAYKTLISLERLQRQGHTIPPALLAVTQAVYAGMLGTIVSATFLTQGFTWPIYILAALIVAVAQWHHIFVKDKLKYD
ncbi:O-antigen ligase family protein [Catenovulum sp. SM1970]|uniref:O-antigen ligase family protein n=1 Tax=Marinifaba aquimaris TaxID=2741323 RepID=UPI00157307F5|nr:O-antigen ligase family protein [Marinifaba aquimaris]NTS76175.1 O-antigen ligase family protein [Marinifaba aquimaris]